MVSKTTPPIIDRQCSAKFRAISRREVQEKPYARRSRSRMLAPRNRRIASHARHVRCGGSWKGGGCGSRTGDSPGPGAGGTTGSR